MAKESSPYSLIADAGRGYIYGAIGGIILHVCRSVAERSRGFRDVGLRASRLGGILATCGALYSANDCLAGYIRDTDDGWNGLISAAVTGGMLQAKKGVRPVVLSSIAGASTFLFIEASVYYVDKKMKK